MGIGTSAPATSFHVVSATNGGGIRIQGTASSYSPALAQFLGTTQYLTLASAASNQDGLATSVAGDSVVKNVANFALLFGTNNTEKMRIANDRKTGIGTTAPAAMLQIDSNATGTENLILKQKASQTADMTQWKNSSGTTLASVDASGNLKVGTAGASMEASTGSVYGAALNVNQTAAADSLKVQDSGTAVLEVYDGGIVDMPKQSG